MAILITGSTGYIGYHLTQKLAATGQQLHLVCRTPPSGDLFKHPAITVFNGDITDKESLKPAMEGVNEVYHLAAYARLWSKDPSVFHKLNVIGTDNVLSVAKSAGAKKVVYTSTAGVIGPSKGQPMTEKDPRITGFFNLYESTKSEAEQLALSYTQQGLDLCILNPSRIYGPGFDTGSNPVTKIIELYVKGKWKIIPGSGNDIGSYPYIDDVVDGHIAAMQKGRSGERYIFGGVNITFNELIAAIKKYSGVNRSLIHIPFSLLNLLSRFMLWNANRTGKYPMITPDWVAKYKYDWALDSSKAITELDYKIRPIDDGIQRTIAWVRQTRM